MHLRVRANPADNRWYATCVACRAVRRIVGLAGVVVMGIACASTLPSPPYTSQPTSALAEVPYPPPPARVETVPERPEGKVVWIDGEWMWQSRRWTWKPGRWVSPPPGARFAPWTTVRDRLGTLYFASGAWRDAKGAEVPEPEPRAASQPNAVPVFTPEGEEVKPAPVSPILDGGGDELDAGASSALDGATMDAEAP